MQKPITEPNPRPDLSTGRRRTLGSLLIVVGTLLCVLITSLGISAGGGYIAGRRERSSYMTQTVSADLEAQYEAAQEDIANGQYSLAVQRIQFILQIDPDYPGAADRLAEIARLRNEANAPPPPPTPIPPSTAEDVDELYAEAAALYETQEWAGAIDRLEELQALAPDYQADDIQERLYEARRLLGLQYVRSDRLQEGVVLLQAADRIRPLDDQSAGELFLAELYLTGLSYWELGWNTVIRNLVIIYEIAPDYRDVEERLLTAYTSYGDQLVVSGSYCQAVEQYESALAIEEDDDLAGAAEDAADLCANPPTAGASPSEPGSTPVGTVTLTPGPTPPPTLRAGDIP
ncbi:MAG: hypothetical protein GYB64_10170 [Chloroflexi bacterium]|nr:hypothetical protein [Chloroflexota bacterium]